jgi:putative membrane protein
MFGGWASAPWLWGPLLGSAALYAYAVYALSARGKRWSPWRSISYAGGLLAIAIALVSPLAAHDELFPVHMVQHMLLGMLGPLLLAFSAPVTLALRTLPRAGRKRMVWLLHSRAIWVLAHPLTATTLFLGGIYGVYFTRIYDDTLRHPLLHDLVHLHLLASGCLLMWAFVAIDPVPRIGTDRMRLILLFIALGGHEALAKILYAGYSSVTAVSPEQLHLGAGIMYYGGDLIDVVVVFVFCRRWYVQSGRRLRHQQRLRQLTDPGSTVTNDATPALRGATHQTCVASYWMILRRE